MAIAHRFRLACDLDFNSAAKARPFCRLGHFTLPRVDGDEVALADIAQARAAEGRVRPVGTPVARGLQTDAHADARQHRRFGPVSVPRPAKEQIGKGVLHTRGAGFPLSFVDFSAASSPTVALQSAWAWEPALSPQCHTRQ